MARGAARNGPRRSALRPEIAFRRRTQPRFNVRAERHYWMASFAGLFSVALADSVRLRPGRPRRPEPPETDPQLRPDRRCRCPGAGIRQPARRGLAAAPAVLRASAQRVLADHGRGAGICADAGLWPARGPARAAIRLLRICICFTGAAAERLFLRHAQTRPQAHHCRSLAGAAGAHRDFDPHGPRTSGKGGHRSKRSADEGQPLLTRDTNSDLREGLLRLAMKDERKTKKQLIEELAEVFLTAL